MKKDKGTRVVYLLQESGKMKKILFPISVKIVLGDMYTLYLGKKRTAQEVRWKGGICPKTGRYVLVENKPAANQN